MAHDRCHQANIRSDVPDFSHALRALMAVDAAISDTRANFITGARSAAGALPRWSILLLAAIAVRALTFGNPVVHVDEEFYFLTAQAMLQGAVPFVDIWDRKPIGLFLIYLPAAAFGTPQGIWIYQIMALASLVGTALLLARLADRAGWGRGAMASALLYIFMVNFCDGQGGQAPIFYNLVVVGAVSICLPRRGETSGDRQRIHRGMWAMLMIGIAMQIKYSVVFEGLFLGLWLLWREWKLGTTPPHILRRGTAYAAMAIVPTMAAWLAYVSIGHGGAWFYANFSSILDRKSDPSLTLLLNFVTVTAFLAPLLIVGALSARHVPANDDHEQANQHLLYGWLVASVIGLVAFGSWFNHYALPVMAPAALCCAGFLGSTEVGRKWLTSAMVIAALIGGEFMAWTAKARRGDAAQQTALVDLIGQGPGCLYVHSGNTSLYSYSSRCRTTPWIFPSHLSRERENGAVGVDQIDEVRRIFAQAPEIVVMRPEYSGERLEVRQQAMTLMAQKGYRLRGRAPLGNLMLSVYALPTASAGATRLASNKPS